LYSGRPFWATTSCSRQSPHHEDCDTGILL
jgi:hypothetical protein